MYGPDQNQPPVLTEKYLPKFFFEMSGLNDLNKPAKWKEDPLIQIELSAFVSWLGIAYQILFSPTYLPTPIAKGFTVNYPM